MKALRLDRRGRLSIDHHIRLNSEFPEKHDSTEILFVCAAEIREHIRGDFSPIDVSQMLYQSLKIRSEIVVRIIPCEMNHPIPNLIQSADLFDIHEPNVKTLIEFNLRAGVGEFSENTDTFPARGYVRIEKNDVPLTSPEFGQIRDSTNRSTLHPGDVTKRAASRTSTSQETERRALELWIEIIIGIYVFDLIGERRIVLFSVNLAALSDRDRISGAASNDLIRPNRKPIFR